MTPIEVYTKFLKRTEDLLGQMESVYLEGTEYMGKTHRTMRYFMKIKLQLNRCHKDLLEKIELMRPK